ncbi:MAG TPA: prepilin-type N-terminal cleavage/methylation domain-containing protein [bacterium]|nr:prepilin-type N-terminal cleavage/methylation domain-containing protein [bacterium]HPN31241.1 prepilin-type N-terminal cleavage/methylation domain-containing protein [bacterium]
MKNAFTIVELLITLSITSLLFLGIYNLYSYNFKAFHKAEELNIAVDIANNFKEEILSKPLKSSFENIPESDNENNFRINFNTAFDYNNYNSQAADIFGNSIDAYNNFYVKILVKKVVPDKYNNIVNTVSDSGYASVSITVFKNKKSLIDLPFVMTE